MIRFLLDSIVCAELPEGCDDLATTVSVDRQLLYLRDVQVDTRLTWHRDGYRYLRDRYHASDGCGEVLLEIQQDPFELGEWRALYRGVIKLPAVTWSYEPDQCATPVEDRSWRSYLANNRDLEVDVTLPQTKNGEVLTPCQKYAYTFQDPAGVLPNVQRDAYLVYDVLAYVVAFLSDHRVRLESSVLGPGGDYQGYVLQTGYRLRTGLELFEPLTVKLSDLLQELSRNFALGVELQPTGADTATLRLERVTELNRAQTVLQLQEIHPLTVSADAARLYGTVKVGSATTLPQAGALSFPESVRWEGFGEEQYYLLGQCNLNAELDLSRQYVVSSNVLQEIIFNGGDGFDDQVCLVQVLTAVPVVLQTNWLGGSVPPTFFNRGLTNAEVTRRWLGGIPSTLASELGQLPQGLFLATNPQMQFNSIDGHYFPSNVWVGNSIYPLHCSDDSTAPNFDQGNWYDPTTYRWTAASAGLFSFRVTAGVRLYITSISVGPLDGQFQHRVRLRLRRYDAANTLLNNASGPWTYFDSRTVGMYNTNPYPPPPPRDYVLPQLQFAAQFAVDATDYVDCYLEVETFVEFGNWVLTTQVLPGATFECTRTTDFGNFTETVDGAANLNQLVKFRAPISRPELEAYLADLGGAVEVRTNGRLFRGWVEQLKYDHGTGLADFTLLTSKDLLPHP